MRSLAAPGEREEMAPGGPTPVSCLTVRTAVVSGNLPSFRKFGEKNLRQNAN